MNPRDLLRIQPVLPVIVIEQLATAVPLARALAAGGVRVLEVTLRTPVALESIRAISEAVPEAVLGAGTLLSAEDVAAAREAGAVFGVSPGTTPSLLRAARASGWTLLPGVQTASEAMTALDEGYDTLKFFPAVQAGGTAMLKALAGPFPELRFCPTGGITADTARDFLGLPNVLCVGGSWLAPKALVECGDWAAITELARASTRLTG